MDGYIRVSKKNGREGPGYISPDLQEENIRRWAAEHGADLGEILEEEDVSGAKPLNERALGRLVQKCENGDSDGIIVNETSRFARSLWHIAETCERLEKTRGRLVGVTDGVDSSAPGGEMFLNFNATMAREQWKRLRKGFGDAATRAARDGVHLGRTPPGYQRENGKRSRLVPDRETRDVVRDVFRRRAQGASWKELADFLREHGVTMSASGVQGMVKSRTYLGEVHGPQGAVNLEAHEPLVSKDEWDAAQESRGRAPVHTGRFSSTALVGGLIRCAGCGNLLSVTGAGKGAKRRAVYHCRKDRRHVCPAPASAVAAYVDAYVRDSFAVALFDGTLATTMDAVERYARAEAAVRQAERELDELADLDLRRALGKERHDAMVTQARVHLDEAKRVMRETPKPGDAVVPTAEVFGPEWPMERQRALAKQFIADIRLRRAEGYGRGAEPVSERIEIRWAGHDDADASLPTRVAELRAEMQPVDRLLVAAS